MLAPHNLAPIASSISNLKALIAINQARAGESCSSDGLTCLLMAPGQFYSSQGRDSLAGVAGTKLRKTRVPTSILSAERPASSHRIWRAAAGHHDRSSPAYRHGRWRKNST